MPAPLCVMKYIWTRIINWVNWSGSWRMSQMAGLSLYVHLRDVSLFSGGGGGGTILGVRVQHYKYLGITLDANLNFHEHVDRLHCKLSSRLGALRRTRKHLTVDAANKVYTATILPLLDYCDIAWSSIGKTACARLDKLQERASKLILPQSREPLKHLRWLPLAKRRDMHTTTMTFRCMSGKVPISFKQYFKRNSCPYELRKNKNNLMIPRVNTEIARGSFYYSGAKLYNNLPNKIKTSLSMSALKKFYFK